MLRSALALTLTEFLLRGVSMLFQRYLALRVGAAGVGLLQLILSVGGLAMTLGLSGLRVAAMYLCAEEYGKKRRAGVRQAMKQCLLAGSMISLFAALALFTFSDYAARVWIKDMRAAQALRILAVFLPANCLCAILSGFFTACDRVRELVRIEALERMLALALTFLLLRLKAGCDTARACSAVVLGSGLSCLASTLFQLRLYRRSFPRQGVKEAPLPMGKRLWRIALPLALSAYLRSGLSTLEQFLIPWGLQKSGGSSGAAMAAYGTVHGMVFPAMMFPAAIIYTLADLLVPELARCRAEENAGRIRHLTRTCLRMGLLFSLSAASLIAANARALGLLLYQSAEAGRYLLQFSPMVVMLYMDAMVDGMLKGLGEQVACVRYNTLTSVLDVALLYLLLPRGGMRAYVAVFALTHAVNFFLSIRKLFRVTGYRAEAGFLPRAVFCALGALGAALCAPWGAELPAVFLRAGGYGLVFFLFLDLTGTFTGEDRRWLRGSLGLRG